MIAPFIYGSTASLHCAALPYLYSWESGIGRHWCVCRGGACPARPRSGKRTAKSIGCTAVSAVPPDVSLRGGHRPTWQSREGSYDFADGFPVIWSGTARLPRRFAPRNDKSGAVAILTMPCTSRRFTAGPGCPLPYSTPRSAGFFHCTIFPGKNPPCRKKAVSLRKIYGKALENRTLL